MAPPPRVADNVAVDPTQTALIVAIPEAEPAVAEVRDRLDRSASWGVPAHVTVVFPFLPPEKIDESVAAVLSRVARSVPAFFLTLDRFGWFDQRVLWLAPDPPEPFRHLTVAVTARFPSAQPYGGAFDRIIPHLTVAHDHPVDDLRAAATEVQAHLPIRARVTALRLITGRPEPGGAWTTLAEFPLG